MRKDQVALTLAVVALAVAALACSLPAVTTPAPTPTSTVQPTPTAALPQVTPVSVAEPANALEAQVERVYDQAGPAVVNITSRVIAYDRFMQLIPQEGTGSGFVYDTEGHIVTNYHVVVDAEAASQHEWYRGHFLSVEGYRGLDTLDDNLYAGLFQATLRPGELLTIVASTDAAPNLDGASAYTERQAYEKRLVAQSGLTDAPAWVQHLVLAADQFIVCRALPDDPDGRTVIAGYPWFGDWGRDTMISLPGLTLVTGRHNVAARILRTFAHFVDQGMLPNRFPDEGETPEYNTMDATLWYFEAIRAYHAATGDDALLHDLFPVLRAIIDWHRRGTRYNIHVDPADGLLYAGGPGVQLTWMDAKVGDWVVTPRIGKVVEINALWYNALYSIADFARRLGEPADRYETLAEQACAGFARLCRNSGAFGIKRRAIATT